MKYLDKIKSELESDSEDVRFLAWMSLYSAKTEEARQEIEVLLKGGNVSYKILFCRFLALIEEDRAVLYLQQLLLDNNDVVVTNAIRAFSKNKNTGKIAKLIPVLGGQNQEAVSFAVEQLCSGNIIEATNILLTMLPKVNEKLLVKILIGLRFLSDRRAYDGILVYTQDARQTVRFEAFMTIGALYHEGMKKVRKVLLQGLADDEPEIRQGILWILRKQHKKSDLKWFLIYSKTDPVPAVRQEALLGLIYFPRKHVIKHLMQILVNEKSHYVVLRCETVLLSFPNKKLLKGLKALFKEQDTKIRNKVLVLYAEFKKTSTKYYHYLAESLQEAKKDLEKVPIIESLGMLGDKRGIYLLESLLHGSPLISYVSMTSILKIWGNDSEYPLLRYLKDDSLSDLLKQNAIKHFNKINLPELYTEELIHYFIGYLKSDNLNMRYLSAVALSRANYDDALLPFFDTYKKENDKTAFLLLQDSILFLLNRNPDMFELLMAEYQKDSDALEKLLELFKKTNFEKQKLLNIIMMLVRAPYKILKTNKKGILINIVVSFYTKKRYSLQDVFDQIQDSDDDLELLEGLLLAFENRSIEKIDLSIQKLKNLYDKSSSKLQSVIVLLLSYSDSLEAIGFLVSIICKNKDACFYDKAVDVLNKRLEVA